MKSFLLCGAFSSLLIIGFPAHALHVDMKPGLWETTIKMNDSSLETIQQAQQDQMKAAMVEMKKQMANLTPEQRKMMEDSGIKLTDDGATMGGAHGLQISKDGLKTQGCVTQEEINRGELPEQDENCEQKITQVSATKFKTTYVCKGETPMRGEGEVTFLSPKLYTGKATFTTVMNGKPQTILSEQTGKWLSSDCGDVKPETYKHE